jgi:hypothetical protein
MREECPLVWAVALLVILVLMSLIVIVEGVS